jgi:hypothetical protein
VIASHKGELRLVPAALARGPVLTADERARLAAVCAAEEIGVYTTRAQLAPGGRFYDLHGLGLVWVAPYVYDPRRCYVLATAAGLAAAGTAP